MGETDADFQKVNNNNKNLRPKNRVHVAGKSTRRRELGDKNKTNKIKNVKKKIRKKNNNK